MKAKGNDARWQRELDTTGSITRVVRLFFGDNRSEQQLQISRLCGWSLRSNNGMPVESWRGQTTAPML